MLCGSVRIASNASRNWLSVMPALRASDMAKPIVSSAASRFAVELGAVLAGAQHALLLTVVAESVGGGRAAFVAHAVRVIAAHGV